jgi:uncharacterized surface protein with fasciclin (FAS1) repeats
MMARSLFLAVVALSVVGQVTANNSTTNSTTTGGHKAPATLVPRINAYTDDPTDPDGLSLFRDALQATEMFEQVLGDKNRNFTVFAPTNAAINASGLFRMYLDGLDDKPPRWHVQLKQVVMMHIIPDKKFTVDRLFNKKITSLDTMLHNLTVSQWDQHVGGAAIVEGDIYALNGRLHLVDKVIMADFMQNSFSNLELQSEFGPDDLNRTSLVDVIDHVEAREALNQFRPEGQTFVGCRIRAFNRMEEYLPQTINNSTTVKDGELMDPNFKNETYHNFILYNIIPQNFYMQDMRNGFLELTVPIANCGHMWVTYNNDELCFNNGCVVTEPTVRQFMASNGYVAQQSQISVLA